MVSARGFGVRDVVSVRAGEHGLGLGMWLASGVLDEGYSLGALTVDIILTLL